MKGNLHQLGLGVLCITILSVSVSPIYAETWRGLTVAPEYRCSEFKRERDYRYPPSIEHQIVEQLGGVIYGPYSKRCFASISETDIEHIVAVSEAHDSGLCAHSRETRERFARDFINLTLADLRLNRHRKKGKDAADWTPEHNRCWFAVGVVGGRKAYGLNIDRQKADTLEKIPFQMSKHRDETTGMYNGGNYIKPPYQQREAGRFQRTPALR